LQGNRKHVLLGEANFIPAAVTGLWVNLFALISPLTARWLISNLGPMLTLKKDDISIAFDRIFATKDGFLGGVMQT